MTALELALLRIALPLLLQALQKSGLIDEAEAIAAKFGLAVISDVEGLKTYSAPTDFPVEVKAGGV